MFRTCTTTHTYNRVKVGVNTSTIQQLSRKYTYLASQLSDIPGREFNDADWMSARISLKGDPGFNSMIPMYSQ